MAEMAGIPKGKGWTVGKHPGESPAHNVAGSPGVSKPAQPIPGPTNPGPPLSMQKALDLDSKGRKKGRK